MLKTLANCRPTEFLSQTVKIKNSVAKWLTETDIRNIRRKMPNLEIIPEGATEDEKASISKRNEYLILIETIRLDFVEMFSRNYVIEHCINEFNKKQIEKSYQIYVTDALQAIAENTTHLLEISYNLMGK